MITAQYTPPPALRILGRMVDTYRQIFVSGPTAPLLSQPNPVRRGGFSLSLIVDEVRPEAEDVLSFTLRARDGAALPAWRPGAHLDIFLPSGRQRPYSLCGHPRDRSRYRIAVRRLADGDGGSRELHDTIRPGMQLQARGLPPWSLCISSR